METMENKTAYYGEFNVRWRAVEIRGMDVMMLNILRLHWDNLGTHKTMIQVAWLLFFLGRKRPFA